MRIVGLERMRHGTMRHPELKKPADLWIAHVLQSRWLTPHDVKQSFRHASILKNSRVVFNLGGNRFRVVTVVLYAHQTVEIRFVGTHTEYDRISAQEV